MGFSSVLYTGEELIDDGNYQRHLQQADDLYKQTAGERGSRGRVKRDYAKMPYGALAPYATDTGIPDVPPEQWDEKIKEMETNKTRISDMLLLKKIESKNQAQTNFCWTAAVIGAAEALRVRMNQIHVKLSIASVAAQVKRYNNVGGWGGEALEQVIKVGIVPEVLWPGTYWRDAKYWTPEAQKQAALYRVDRWFELQNRNFRQLMSCVLNRIPVPIGLNWWGHEVYACDGVILGPRQYGIRIRNSWSDDYGYLGFAVLTQSKATPDDAVAPYGMVAA